MNTRSAGILIGFSACAAWVASGTGHGVGGTWVRGTGVRWYRVLGVRVSGWLWHGRWLHFELVAREKYSISASGNS